MQDFGKIVSFGVDGECLSCGGLGRIDAACPNCGKIAKSISNPSFADEIVDLDLVTEDQAREARIPEFYLGKFFNKNIIMQDNPGSCNNSSFINYLEVMDKLESIFKKGNVPNRSAMIFSPNRHAKSVLAYSCMQHALACNRTVAPLMDTNELKHLIVMASERPLQKVCNITLEDYLSSDVCFLKVSNDSYRRNSYETILSLLDKRSRRNLSTVVLSSYPFEEISAWDNKGLFNNLKRDCSMDNPKKIPTIISLRG